MMTKKLLPLSATAVAAALALAGCSTGPSSSSSSSSSTGSSMPGMDHGSGMVSSSAPASTDHNAADTMFAQGMIPHHEQAVKMAEMMLRKKDVPAAVTDLAARIKAAQAPEIETMTEWLKSWNESATIGPGHTMAGIMGEDDLKGLEEAQGTEAAKLFLKQMIAHHEGAVMMAKTETSQGKNADAIKLCNDIVTAQEAEIKEMQDLLAAL